MTAKSVGATPPFTTFLESGGLDILVYFETNTNTNTNTANLTAKSVGATPLFKTFLESGGLDI